MKGGWDFYNSVVLSRGPSIGGSLFGKQQDLEIYTYVCMKSIVKIGNQLDRIS